MATKKTISEKQFEANRRKDCGIIFRPKVLWKRCSSTEWRSVSGDFGVPFVARWAKQGVALDSAFSKQDQERARAFVQNKAWVEADGVENSMETSSKGINYLIRVLLQASTDLHLSGVISEENEDELRKAFGIEALRRCTKHSTKGLNEQKRICPRPNPEPAFAKGLGSHPPLRDRG